jgi:hypothetical protein
VNSAQMALHTDWATIWGEEGEYDGDSGLGERSGVEKTVMIKYF